MSSSTTTNKAAKATTTTSAAKATETALPRDVENHIVMMKEGVLNSLGHETVKAVKVAAWAHLKPMFEARELTEAQLSLAEKKLNNLIDQWNAARTKSK